MTNNFDTYCQTWYIADEKEQSNEILREIDNSETFDSEDEGGGEKKEPKAEDLRKVFHLAMILE